MTRPRRTIPRTPLAPVERHRRSRARLVDRVAALVGHGHGLADIARHEHMPRHATLRRWMARDKAFRARHDVARRLAPHLMAEEMIAEADRLAAVARGRDRIAAGRLQIKLRKWWVDTLRGINDRDARKTDREGVSADTIATLEAEWAQNGARAAVAESIDERAVENGVAAATATDAESDDSASPRDTDGEVADTPGYAAEDTRRARPTASPKSPGAEPRTDRHGDPVNNDPPTPFVPRWFDDHDLRRRREPPPYDPLS